MSEYTVRQASDMSGLSERHIWRLVAKGTLVHRRDDDGHVWIAQESLAGLAAKRERAAPGGSNRELRHRVEQLERRIAELEQRISLAGTVTRVSRARPVAQIEGSAQQLERGLGGDLPDTLVGIQELANVHHVPAATVSDAVGRGDIPFVAGSWRRGRGHLNRAIDVEGQRAFYALYHNHPRFQACADCPH